MFQIILLIFPCYVYKNSECEYYTYITYKIKFYFITKYIHLFLNQDPKKSLISLQKTPYRIDLRGLKNTWIVHLCGALTKLYYAWSNPVQILISSTNNGLVIITNGSYGKLQVWFDLSRMNFAVGGIPRKYLINYNIGKWIYLASYNIVIITEF